MQPVQNIQHIDEFRGTRQGLSPRGRLTATLLALAEEQQTDASINLSDLADVLDEVLALDCRFPFHLAAFVKEKIGRTRVAVALLVEAANRVGESRRRAGRSMVLPFALRPLVHRIVGTAADAAYAMAYQVRHFGWAMPTPLRLSLTEVLHRSGDTSLNVDDADPAPSAAPARRALQPILASA